MENRDVDRQFEHDFETVAERYRACAQEQAPTSLGRLIKKEAARGSRQSASLQAVNRWLRPVTAFATLSITVALVLQLDNQVIVPAERIDDTAAQAAGSALRDAGLTTLEAVNSATNTVSGSTESTGSVDAGNPDPLADTGTEIADERTCSRQQRENASTWWQCIQALETQGFSDAATRELAAILETFPTFRAPQNQR